MRLVLLSLLLLYGCEPSGEVPPTGTAVPTAASSSAPSRAYPEPRPEDMVGSSSLPFCPPAVEMIYRRDRLRTYGQRSFGDVHVLCVVGPVEDAYIGEVWTKCSGNSCRWLATTDEIHSELSRVGVEFGWCEREIRP